MMVRMYVGSIISKVDHVAVMILAVRPALRTSIFNFVMFYVWCWFNIWVVCKLFVVLLHIMSLMLLVFLSLLFNLLCSRSRSNFSTIERTCKTYASGERRGCLGISRRFIKMWITWSYQSVFHTGDQLGRSSSVYKNDCLLYSDCHALHNMWQRGRFRLGLTELLNLNMEGYQ